MNHTPEDPRARLLQHLLSEAQKTLDADHLEEAQNLFEEALRVEGHHPNRALDTRRVLKQYSDRVIAQTPPNWDLAYRALDLLGSLKLQDDETRAWQRDLKLRQAQFLLEKEDDLDKSFNIFTDLMANAERLGVQDKLKANIARVVRSYVSQRAAQRQWSSLHQLFKRVQKLWTPTDGLGDWLEAISQILAAAAQAQTEYNQRLVEIEQSYQRTRNLTYVLLGIFVLAALAYILVLLL
jgi:hypothetical protein